MAVGPADICPALVAKMYRWRKIKARLWSAFIDIKRRLGKRILYQISLVDSTSRYRRTLMSRLGLLTSVVWVVSQPAAPSPAVVLTGLTCHWREPKYIWLYPYPPQPCSKLLFHCCPFTKSTLSGHCFTLPSDKICSQRSFSGLKGSSGLFADAVPAVFSALLRSNIDRRWHITVVIFRSHIRHWPSKAGEDWICRPCRVAWLLLRQEPAALRPSTNR